MDFWTMIVLIVTIGAISDIIKTKKDNDTEKAKKYNEDESQIIARLKDRVANLETIILEKERVKRFEDLE
jgi:hypothetical protein